MGCFKGGATMWAGNSVGIGQGLFCVECVWSPHWCVFKVDLHQTLLDDK